MDFVKRISNWIKYLLKKKGAKIGIIVITHLVSILLSIWGTAIYYDQDTTPQPEFLYSAYLILISAATLILFVLKGVFSLELTEKSIQLTQKKLESEELQSTNFTKSVVENMVSLLSQRTGGRDTIYEERTNQYKSEKYLLANEYIATLGDRIQELLNEKKEVCLIFDSGTTISPILNALGREAEKDEFHWARSGQVKIYTNNINGIIELLKYRKQRDMSHEIEDRHQEIPVSCNVLPGEVLSAYEATAGVSTLIALKKIATQNKHIISVSTGNYIFYMHEKRHLLPIARTGFHPHIKCVLYHISNEVFLIAPLGKILKSGDLTSFKPMLDGFNSDLNYINNAKYISQRPYSLVSPDFFRGFLKNLDNENNSLKKIFANFNDTIMQWQKKSILVTTSRLLEPHLMYSHFRYIKKNLLDYYNNPGTKINRPKVISYPFSDIPLGVESQIEQEIPHKNLIPFKEKYFEIS